MQRLQLATAMLLTAQFTQGPGQRQQRVMETVSHQHNSHRAPGKGNRESSRLSAVCTKARLSLQQSDLPLAAASEGQVIPHSLQVYRCSPWGEGEGVGSCHVPGPPTQLLHEPALSRQRLQCWIAWLGWIAALAGCTGSALLVCGAAEESTTMCMHDVQRKGVRERIVYSQLRRVPATGVTNVPGCLQARSACTAHLSAC